jgi:biopolymer transport protein ExbD
MKKSKVEEEISPNLIPMIDIMFLLLLFFMLGADMGQRELEQVVLPKAASVKEDKESKDGKIDRITLNVYHQPDIKCAVYSKQQVCREDRHWRVGMRGRDFTDPEMLGGMLKKEADLARGADPKMPQVSDRKVMIRADGKSPYGLSQRAMNVCAKVGIYKIEVGAARPNPDGKKG